MKMRFAWVPIALALIALAAWKAHKAEAAPLMKWTAAIQVLVDGKIYSTTPLDMPLYNTREACVAAEKALGAPDKPWGGESGGHIVLNRLVCLGK